MGWFKKNFFPIHNNEIASVAYFNVLFFLVACTYGMLRVMKETYVTAVGGSSLIFKVKTFVIVPTMILFKYLYDTISSRTTANGCIYAVMGYFLGFFLLFYCVLVPCFVDEEAVRILGEQKNASVLQQVKVLWPYILFYANAEGFGTFAISIIAWGFANRMVSKEQSPRWYFTFSLGTGAATIIAGLFGLYVYAAHSLIFGMICYCIVAFIGVYYCFVEGIKRSPKSFQLFPKVPKKKKKKLGFLASIRALLGSDQRVHLGLILVLVLSYSCLICLFEGVYKDWVNKVGNAKVLAGEVGHRKDFVTQMSGLQLICTGISSIVIALFLSAPVRRRGWRFTAMVVPAAVLLGSFFFFGVIYLGPSLRGLGWSEMEVLMGVFFAGLAVVVLVKSGKYVFFDATKEVCYGPLSAEEKRTGKSAVDGVGARTGKAGGALLMMLLQWLVGVQSALELKWVIAVLIVAGCCIWIAAVFKLDVILSGTKQEKKKVGNTPV